MMPDWWREIFDTDALDTLRYLREQALELHELFAKGPADGDLGEAVPRFKEYQKYHFIGNFRKLTEQKSDVLGPARVRRILLANVPLISEADVFKDEAARGNPEHWANEVLRNIDSEIEVIRNKRAQLQTWIATAAAAASAIASVISAAIALIALMIKRS